MSDNDDKIVDKDFPKSKSEIKREMIELQRLGERLVLLNAAQLKKLSLPLILEEAVLDAKKITSHGAKRRQFQYIGRLMRDVKNPEVIREFFAALEMKHQRSSAFHHMLESWRERLLSDDATQLTEFIKLYPIVDRQHLRVLVQNAKKERSLGKPVGAARLLFRYLKQLQQENKFEEDN